MDHKRILAQTCANILVQLVRQSVVSENLDITNQINKLADIVIDPMDNGWWGLYDDTYKELLSPEIYQYIHLELLIMYQQLFE